MLLKPTALLRLFAAGLLLFGLAACATAPERTATRPHATPPAKAAPAARDPQIAAVPRSFRAAIARVNRFRAAHGRGPVTLHRQLNRAARGHAQAMADRDFFSHRGADGSRFGQRVSRTGYVWGLVAENIAAGQKTPMEAIETWIDSPSHRRNMLMKGVIHLGLAHVRRDPDPGDVSFKDYWVMVLAAPQ